MTLENKETTVSEKQEDCNNKINTKDILNENQLCNGCNKCVEHKLSCPTCLKYNITSIFCSQDCFKRNWSSHKATHKLLEELIKQESNQQTLYTTGYETLNKGFDWNNTFTWICDVDLRHFKDFKFTGLLRPWPRTPIRIVPSHIPKPDYYKTGDPISENRRSARKNIEIRTADEIDKLREACKIARQALDLGHSMIKPGTSADDIDCAVHEFIINNNAYPSTLYYLGFTKSCCISINEVICHGIPDLRPLQNGDIVNIDITVFYKGFHGDLNETYICGEASDTAKELVKTAYNSMMYAIAECTPGMLYREIGGIISNYAEKKKFSVVRTYSGHGIGTSFHTAPSVPHFKKNKAVGIMKPGHVFTIEPMINEGNWRDLTWPDDWTSVTIDGKLSAQFEHTMLITKDGVEILTSRLSESPPLEIDVPPESYYLTKKHKN